ncbi:adenosylmethionine decarboxylase [Paenibacillus sp. MWE-103]|uniref:S-adenosylmethionine decarboxylase proenzyme n=1 Tax=Paenibacillus artemisiicola TaxID=1172618 RepID=A0ABS3WDQ9_9BACL|nr:adenosylmethionine decarboxylase [Paenibacillus artemisiicola]MBO7746465.1 adenosylmethionine decarboxylase [Paenibacillus artemisiicola]
MTYSTFGKHIIVDVWGVDFACLNDIDFLRSIMLDAATQCGAKVISISDKEFDPNGCTILVLLSESHLSIHTYPEKEFAAIDCYTCGENVDPKIAIDYLIDRLSPMKIYTKFLIRGSNEIDVMD